MLYKVTIGQDVYLGTAEEVVAYMMRAEGAGGSDVSSYMIATAARLAERLDILGIDASDEVAFLDALRERGVLAIEVFEEPSERRSDPRDAVGDGPVAYGPGVNPHDVEL
ncbi:MAG: hypothetical protein O2894_08225 [Planctomycetota bacterium]|nr:hypothetical protein [Planctomycetota bacterium]